MAKDKTIQDYKLEVSKLKQKYQSDKMNHNWNYNFKEEEHDSFNYFMITNHFEAVKVLFDKESGVLVKKEMYTADVKTMMELQGTL